MLLLVKAVTSDGSRNCRLHHEESEREDQRGDRGLPQKSKEELFNLRFQSATGQLENTARLKAVKHDIARMYTVLRERELGISQAPEATETKAEEK